MTKDRKIEALKEALDPFVEVEEVFSKRYSFNYHGENSWRLRESVKTFYAKHIPEKYGARTEVVQTDLVDQINKERLADSFQGAFLLTCRGQEVTVWVGSGFFELIAKVKYYKVIGT